MVFKLEDFITVPDDEEESENFTISELVSSLKSAFRPSIFGRVEKMLIVREEKIELEKQALEAKMQRNSEELRSKQNRVLELEKELQVYRKKCSELSVELDKFGKLEFRNFTVEDELKDYKRTCDELKERITSLEEDQKVVCERERRAKERITNLSEELKKVERDEREKYVELKTKNIDLENAKRRAENEIEVWKKRFTELETRVLRLEEESSILIDMESQLCVRIKMESCEQEGNKFESNGETNRGRSQLQIKKEMLNCDGMINGSTYLGSTCRSLVKGGEVLLPGPPSIDILRKPLVNVGEEKNSIALESEVEYGSRVRKQLAFQLGGNSNKKLASPKLNILGPTRGIVDISDSENENDITPERTSSIGDTRMSNVSIDHAMRQALDHERKMTSQKCLKRTRSEHNGEENGSISENFPLISTLKRKRDSDTVTSYIKSSDEDSIPIDKLKMKKHQELAEGIHELSDSPVKRCSVAPTVSCCGQNSEKPVSPPRKHLIPQRQCEGKRSGAERNSLNHLEMSGVIVNGSEILDSEDDSSDSENEEDKKLKPILLMIRRNTGNRSKWHYEADMLSSFEADPELCMRAVCAIYRQLTSEEKSKKSSLHSSNQVFNEFDTRGTKLAKFLMDGDQKGDLKKSVKELKMLDPKALEECKKLAKNYSKQLFDIYKNKKDQFF